MGACSRFLDRIFACICKCSNLSWNGWCGESCGSGSEIGCGGREQSVVLDSLVWWSIFIMLPGEKDQQRIRLVWPLRREGFPDEQPSVAWSKCYGPQCWEQSRKVSQDECQLWPLKQQARCMTQEKGSGKAENNVLIALYCFTFPFFWCSDRQINVFLWASCSVCAFSRMP